MRLAPVPNARESSPTVLVEPQRSFRVRDSVDFRESNNYAQYLLDVVNRNILTGTIARMTVKLPGFGLPLNCIATTPRHQIVKFSKTGQVLFPQKPSYIFIRFASNIPCFLPL